MLQNKSDRDRRQSTQRPSLAVARYQSNTHWSALTITSNDSQLPPPGALPAHSPAPQSWLWVSSGTSAAPAEPRPDSDGFSMKNRWQLNGLSIAAQVGPEEAAVGLHHPALRHVVQVGGHDLADDLRLDRGVGRPRPAFRPGGSGCAPSSRPTRCRPAPSCDGSPWPLPKQTMRRMFEEAPDDGFDPDVLATAP